MKMGETVRYDERRGGYTIGRERGAVDSRMNQQ